MNKFQDHTLYFSNFVKNFNELKQKVSLMSRSMVFKQKFKEYSENMVTKLQYIQ